MDHQPLKFLTKSNYHTRKLVKMDIESKGNHVLNIHEDAIAIIYLQVGEIPIRLIPKERDQIVHRAK
ncbi:unnamed protein product [Sphagnum jensenii]|uniref:Uncharacterized protein n=1 Tax=Sphagnum jensenii TaxID=128206 RepID=A0ABP0VPL2_9BRYO